MIGRRSPRAFTLLELLAVIVVLGILAALLLPKLAGNRPPLVPQCLVNQRQIAVAAIMYAGDHRTRLPNLDGISGNDGPGALLTLTNYLKEPYRFICPFVARQRKRDGSWYQKEFTLEFSRSFFLSNGNDYAYYDGLKAESSTNAFLSDRMAWTNRSSVTASRLPHGNNRINVSFSDGHIETVRPEKVIGADYTPPWSAVQDPLARP